MAKSNFIVRGGNFNPLYKEFNKAQKKMAFQSGTTKLKLAF